LGVIKKRGGNVLIVVINGRHGYIIGLKEVVVALNAILIKEIAL
jgi:hypothetical protein